MVFVSYMLTDVKIAVLHNAESGINKRKGYHEIQQLLSEYPDIEQAEVRNLQDMRSSLSDFMRMQAGLILINGGDGTLQAVLTLLFVEFPKANKPLLAVLPSGTTNMTAGDVGLRGKRVRAVKSLLQGIRSESFESICVTRPVLRVRYRSDDQAVYGMFFGAAGIYAGIEYCRRHIHSIGVRGEWGPGLAMLNVITAFILGRTGVLKPARIGMQVNDEEFQQKDLMLVYATTLERLFLGIRPFLKTSAAPINFTAIRSEPRHMLRILPSFIRSKAHRLFTRDNGYTSYSIERLVLRLDGGFTLDGELYQAESEFGPVTVEHGGNVRFVRP